jgi:hypothetical protein
MEEVEASMAEAHNSMVTSDTTALGVGSVVLEVGCSLALALGHCWRRRTTMDGHRSITLLHHTTHRPAVIRRLRVTRPAVTRHLRDITHRAEAASISVVAN